MPLPHALAFNATAAHEVAILPAAPSRCAVPLARHARDTATFAVLADIAVLHLAAFVTLHGPAPQTVAFEPVLHGDPDALTAGHLVRLQGRSCARSAAWMAAARHGLESWSQAGWSNPVVREAGPAGLDHWWTAPIGEAAADAAGRLKRAGRLHELRNLAAHLPGLLPARLDPESPLFGLPVARPTPQGG